MGQRGPKLARFAIPGMVFLLGSGLILAGSQQLPGQEELLAISDDAGSSPSAENCTFLSNSRDFIENKALGFLARSNSVKTSVQRIRSESAGKQSIATVDPNSISRKNLIDDELFTRMAADHVPSAPLATDAEFLRRVYLDLTGRIPSVTDVETFLADRGETKRETLIDRLIASPEFTDKWTMFFGDLYENNFQSTQVNRGTQGRDAFYVYLRDSIAANKPYDQMARELITATGGSFESGAANWPAGNTIAMGPQHDTYDGAAVDVATMFMGINTVDCLLCHDGPRHLDQVSLWGYQQTRQNLWGLSAYFSRTRMPRVAVADNPALTQFMVSDLTTGNFYTLNTTTGNRSARQRAVGGPTFITPRYPFSNSPSANGGIAQGENYRQALARQITSDIQFSRAAVNYIWEKLMVEAFVSPSNSFDLARLDPNNKPPEPWTLQPTNPQLLNRMAQWFQENNYDIRGLMSLITKSSAYQLSSDYGDDWQVGYVPYYARKYVRRLDAEEILDAIIKATNIPQAFPIANTTLPAVTSAMQLPDTAEPRGSAVATFLNTFGRGNRDLDVRRTDGSVLEGLTMMNNAVVTSRIHQANAGSRVSLILAQANNNPRAIIQALFMYTLSRPATEQDVEMFLPSFQQLGTRSAAESLQWVLLNRLQFLFNY